MLTRPHGVKGELRLRPAAQDLEPPDAKRVRVTLARGAVLDLNVASLRRVHEGFLVSFEGYLDRDLCRELCGAVIHVPKASLRASRPGEAYVFELVGAAVVDAEGQSLGTVGAVLANAGQDLLRIDSPAGERLLPMVDATMRGFDRERRVLQVQVIPGLWDDT